MDKISIFFSPVPALWMRPECGAAPAISQLSERTIK